MNSEPYVKRQVRSAAMHPAACQARHLGVGRSIECLVAAPAECVYAAPFGGRHLCLHPQGEQLAIETKSHQQAERAWSGAA